MSIRQLVLSDGTSNKFWNIDLNGDTHTVTYGRVGTTGQTKTKEFGDETEAKKSFDKLCEQKLKKGYVDSVGSGTRNSKRKKPPAKKVTSVKKKPAAKKAKGKKTATRKAVAKKKPVPSKAVTKRATAKRVIVKKSTAKTAKESASAPKKVATVNSCELVFKDVKSSKFWKADIDGSDLTVCYGRIGTNGQSKTKSFPSASVARTEFDKLIAEKRKKGYTDAGAEESVVKPSCESNSTRKTKPGHPGPTPNAVIDLKVSREIALDPADWGVASFRPPAKLDRGKPPEADVDAAADLMCTLRSSDYGWSLPFEKLDLGPMLATEDARFWFYAMTTHIKQRLENKAEVKKFVEKIRKAKKYDGKMTLAEAKKRVFNDPRGVPENLMVALFSLFSAKQCFEIMMAGKPSKTRNFEASEIHISLSKSFRAHVVPYLSKQELKTIQNEVRKTFDPTAMPIDAYSSFPIEHYVAAAIGMHKEIYAATSSWDDDYYVKNDDWADHYQRPQDLLFGLASADLVESEWRRLRLKIREPGHARGFLACTEYSALDVLADQICRVSNKEECRKLLDVLALVKAPEAAEPILHCRLSCKSPAVARDWMEKNVGNSVAGLIETAAGRGKLADAAVDYLRGVKRDGHHDLIAKLVKKAGKRSAGAARVQQDVLDHVEKVYKPMDAKTTPKWLKQAIQEVMISKPLRLPGWAKPNNVPPIIIGGYRVNDEQMATILQVLASTPVSERHPLLTGLRENVDADTRNSFAWHLFQLWQEDGSNSKQKWAMGTIGHLGDDGNVMQLTPLIRNWPGESQHARAVFGLECLRAVGSSTALMQLAGIAQKLKFKGLKTKAAGFVEDIAAEKGMTRAELEDRVIPDCGLDEMGRREFSFGPRSFSFVLGGDLKPMLRDENGKIRPNPPKPGAKDNEKIANESLAAWKLIKKQIKDVAVLQAGRLEQAMTTGRRWSVDDFEALLVRHPLMTHLVQKLIWATYDKNGKQKILFRVTEERDYADAKDGAVSLAKTNSIGAVHPLEMADRDRATWGEVQSDYEIISPFPQLGRDIFALEKGEEKLKELSRFHGLNLYAPTMVFTLEKMGWTRGIAMDAGSFDEHSKQFPGANVTAVVGYDGWVSMGYIDPDEMLTTDSIHFVKGLRGPSGYRDGYDKAIKLGGVPPIVISEVIADLHVLKSKAK